MSSGLLWSVLATISRLARGKPLTDQLCEDITEEMHSIGSMLPRGSLELHGQGSLTAEMFRTIIVMEEQNSDAMV